MPEIRLQLNVFYVAFPRLIWREKMQLIVQGTYEGTTQERGRGADGLGSQPLTSKYWLWEGSNS